MRMGRAPVPHDAPEEECHSAAEFGEALGELSAEDKLKLAAIGRVMCSGTGLDAQDLMHEAICRALEGSRRCPRAVPVMAFLVQTMRSVASHARRSQARMEVDAGATNGQGDPSTRQPTPEESLIEKEEAAAVQAIYGEFEDDQEAQLVLMGWAEELRGAALREATGLDQAGLDYAAKRIRKRLRKLYPQGWNK